MTTIAPFVAATTRAAALASLRRSFAEAGLDTPDLDARCLLCGILGIDAAKLITGADVPLGDAADRLADARRRRLAHEPVSRILGWREFYGRRFEVTPATLDPRPDSETLIDAVLSYVRANGGVDRYWRILDVGTGTGCLLLTLLAELPNAAGVGIDISEAALAVAARNAGQLGLARRAELRRGDALENLAGTFDILVSNPPYIPTRDLGILSAEVRDYDPHLALDGGPDGLVFYRRMIGGLGKVFTNGFAAFEIGHDQGPAVLALLTAEGLRHGWPPPQCLRDLGGHSRCVTQKTQH